MTRSQKRSIINSFITLAVAGVALWYFATRRADTSSDQPLQGSRNQPVAEQVKPSSSQSSSSSPQGASAVSALERASSTARIGAAPGSTSTPSAIPQAFPADQVVVTEGTEKAQIPPDLQAQLDAPPPELPEDLKRQLNAPPPELPADLKAQLNAPPRELPEDIKRALAIPPRIVTLDEVNNPNHAQEAPAPSATAAAPAQQTGP